MHTLAERILVALVERLELPTEAMDRLDGLLPEIEESARRDYGGDRVYIAKPARINEKKRTQIINDYLASDGPVEDVSSRHGIHRSTLYRYLKK